MLKKKSSNTEKKRKRSQPNERHDSNKRRSAETPVEQPPADELADPELDRIGSDIEDGGLDLSLPFKPIGAYVEDKREMLDQCLRVLGERKLRKMLPEELKGCSLEDIRELCWQQLEPLTEKNLAQILAGQEVTSAEAEAASGEPAGGQQDKNVDSTSKAETGGSGEESDVLSINADSDIDGPREEPPPEQPEPERERSAGAGRDVQSAIDESVSQILTLASASGGGREEPGREEPEREEPGSEACSPSSAHAPAVCPPSVQQLELLELEMRARAIKALMKANGGKKARPAAP